ncbi:50S ribosomal protein L6 [Candidatus Woesearchaeota archaeon]|nr:50S ribosomal protein L6 [Candidatus Woesearchaeota archaeon]
MKLDELKNTVVIPEGVSIIINGNTINAKGPHGEVSRKWNNPRIFVKVDGNNAVIIAKNASKKEKRMLVTVKAHIKNMIDGVNKNNECKLKICSSHFPMQVAMEGNTLVVKNFLGEKVARKTTLPKDVQVKIQGDKISLTGPDIETVGMSVSKIEQLCRITNRDRRIFQDGIYLIEKNGRAL